MAIAVIRSPVSFGDETSVAKKDKTVHQLHLTVKSLHPLLNTPGVDPLRLWRGNGQITFYLCGWRIRPVSPIYSPFPGRKNQRRLRNARRNDEKLYCRFHFFSPKKPTVPGETTT